MIYAEKGNRVRQINESEVQQYVEQGYKITDGRGTVLKETVPTDAMSLRLAYQKHTAEIEQLTKQVAQLTQENADLKAENATLISAAKESSTRKKTTKATDKIDE